MHKNKFSEIGLASSKGLFFTKDPTNLCTISHHVITHKHLQSEDVHSHEQIFVASFDPGRYIYFDISTPTASV